MKSPGCGPLAAIVIIAVILLSVMTNEAVGVYYTCDEDEDWIDCIIGAEDEEAAAPEGSVTATGTYEYKGYTVTVTMNVPLDGGAVTGTASGTCEGNVKGTYSGNGAISGSMSGVCAPFFVNIPAGAEWSGTVNESGKTVPIGFTGRGGGITHEGSMMLTYP